MFSINKIFIFLSRFVIIFAFLGLALQLCFLFCYWRTIFKVASLSERNRRHIIYSNFLCLITFCCLKSFKSSTGIPHKNDVLYRKFVSCGFVWIVVSDSCTIFNVFSLKRSIFLLPTFLCDYCRYLRILKFDCLLFVTFNKELHAFFFQSKMPPFLHPHSKADIFKNQKLCLV